MGGGVADELKRRREGSWHNAHSPKNIKRIAEVDCGWFHFYGRGWVRCDALDWAYCLHSKKPCSFWKPALGRKEEK